MNSVAMRRALSVVVSVWVAVGVVGCDKPPSGGEGGEEESAEEAEAESQRPDVEMTSYNLPGVAQIPASMKEEIDKALAEKKKKSDPTYRTHHKTDDGLPKYTNRLITESSPYLQQHAHNPTNWFPWGEEAFEKAKREDKPILLSVGYSTCHWCHVMERESFEDLEIAEYLNENYVAIKVDREQRPHIDDTYMNTVRAMSGRGGWPMTVWMTPEKLPFMGGTYYPPERFMGLLKKLNRQYEEDPHELRQKGQEIASKVNRRMEGAGRGDQFPNAARAMKNAFRQLQGGFDENRGGWGSGNKFPMPSRLQFLMRYHKRTDDPEAQQMVTKTLDAMASGGVYDDIGGGFHRYSTDPQWMVPHFEKMLYDNGQLALTYTEAWQLTKDEKFERIARETLNYLQREMTNGKGGFYAATDAVSPETEGGEDKEGEYFIWTPAEVDQALTDEEAELVKTYYDITEAGNFEGQNILHTPKSRDDVAESLGISRDQFDKRLARARKKMRHVRDQRPHPHTDDNILTAWNGLALEAFARGALVFDNDEWLAQAKKTGEFLVEEMRNEDGRLMRSRTEGVPTARAYSSDYAFAIAGLLNLYEATANPRWIREAAELQRQHLEHYWDEEDGGFYQTSGESDSPIGRQKPDRDGSTPSSNSYAALNLLKLYQFTLNEEFQERAKEVFEAFGPTLERRGARLTRMLVALDFLDSKPREIAFVSPGGSSVNPLLGEYRTTFMPNAVLVRTEASAVSSLVETIPWMEDKGPKKEKPTAYVCRDFTCKYPTTEIETFRKQISEVTPLE